MADKEQQTLPLTPGAKVDDSIAEGLVGAEALTNIPSHPSNEKEAILAKQRDDALPDPETAVPVQPPPEMAADAAESEGEEGAAESEKADYCPKCGWHQASKFEVVPTELDKANFIRAALSGGRFEKAYMIFGGRMEVTFRSRIVEESEDVARHLQWQAVTGNMDVRLLYVMAHKMDMAISISQVRVFDEGGVMQSEQAFPIPTHEVYPRIEIEEECSQCLCERVHHKLFVAKGVGEMTYTALYKEFCKFDALYQMLTVRADDPDFYSATPSAT